MLTQKSLKQKVKQKTHHTINLSDSELVHSEEMRQENKMQTSYYFLYFDYEHNCIVHYKEITEGVIDGFGDVNDVQSLGYEILKDYTFW